MSTEKTSIENENQPSCLGAVSGSTDFLSEKLPIIEWDEYEYNPHIAFYGTEWEIWYETYGRRIPQNVLLNKYGDTLNEALSKMINEVVNSGLKYYR